MQPFVGTVARMTWHLSTKAALAGQMRLPRLEMPRYIHKPRISTATRRLYSTPPQPPNLPSPTASDKETNAASEAAAAAANLPSAAESRRSALNHKFSAVMDNLQARALTASQTLNDVTGYSAIEGIKAANDATERSLGAAQERVRAGRAAYKTSNARRAATQREVTTLLARKDSWTPSDLERFTELYRADHVLEGEVAAAQEALTEAEAEEQTLNQRLNAGILKRYHEEQIWSDRIRRASTWGTWGLMGMNLVMFFVFQFVAEPWRRKRLVRGVVEHEKDVLERFRAEMETLKADLESKMEGAFPAAVKSGGEQQQPASAPVAETRAAQATWAESLQDPSRWKAAAIDLYSERQIDLRMRDASTLVLQGAVAGAAIVGSIAVLATR